VRARASEWGLHTRTRGARDAKAPGAIQEWEDREPPQGDKTVKLKDLLYERPYGQDSAMCVNRVTKMIRDADAERAAHALAADLIEEAVARPDIEARVLAVLAVRDGDVLSWGRTDSAHRAVSLLRLLARDLRRDARRSVR